MSWSQIPVCVGVPGWLLRDPLIQTVIEERDGEGEAGRSPPFCSWVGWLTEAQELEPGQSLPPTSGCPKEVALVLAQLFSAYPGAGHFLGDCKDRSDVGVRIAASLPVSKTCSPYALLTSDLVR